MPDNTQHNEQELIARMVRGDEQALTTIYELYFEPLYLYAFNVLKEQAVAEDIVQELFISLWMQREKLTITSSLKAYLYTANRYQIARAIRSKEHTTHLFDRLEQRIWGAPEPENLLYQKELQARVSTIINELPEKCKEIYLLSREEQLSNKEIAERLHISPKTVENQLTIALRKIRLSLGDLLPMLLLLIK